MRYKCLCVTFINPKKNNFAISYRQLFIIRLCVRIYLSAGVSCICFLCTCGQEIRVYARIYVAPDIFFYFGLLYKLEKRHCFALRRKLTSNLYVTFCMDGGLCLYMRLLCRCVQLFLQCV